MTAILEAPPVTTHSTIEVEPTESTRIETTLFDVIAALQDAADPGDDAAVIAAVAELMQTGRIRFRIPIGRRN
jgi:hypothetical protein